jgi:hypothetical protein
MYLLACHKILADPLPLYLRGPYQMLGHDCLALTQKILMKKFKKQELFVIVCLFLTKI